MKRLLIVFLLMLSLCLQAQVTFSARVFKPSGEMIAPSFMGFRLLVDGEDTVRYWRDTTISCLFNPTGIIRFENIPIGGRCLLNYQDCCENYDYHFSSLNEDLFIDSLVLHRIPVKEDFDVYWNWNRATKDSIMQSWANKWACDVDGYDTIWFESDTLGKKEFYVDEDEPHSLQLARLYYEDWIFPLVTWHTFSHAADSAYKYCLRAYHKAPFLYYPLRQLARYLGVELQINAPDSPDSMTFLQLPDMADSGLNDTTVNLFSLGEEHNRNERFLKYTLGNAKEKSLCYPLAADGTMRYLAYSPLGGSHIYTVRNSSFVYKRYNHWDTLMRSVHYYLTADELDSIMSIINAFHRAGRPDNESGCYAFVDGSDFMLEYVINGRHRTYFTSDGTIPPQLISLDELLVRISKRHEKKE